MNLQCNKEKLRADKKKTYMSFVRTSFKERGVQCTTLVSREPGVVYHEDMLKARDHPGAPKYMDMMSLVVCISY